MTLRAAAAALFLLAPPSARAAPPPGLPPADVMPYSQVRAGMKGVGRTVFQGETLDSFEVEVLGKLDRIGPGQNLILARLSSPILATTGVLEGMSGSPVYIDGRMIGAVAFSWGFSREPIAGITPVEEMLSLPDPLPRPPLPVRPPSGTPATTRRRRVSRDPAMRPALPESLREGLHNAARTAERFHATFAALTGSVERTGGMPRLALPLSVGGISGSWILRCLAQSTLRLQTGGGMALAPRATPQAASGAAPGSSAPIKLSPGDAVGAQLVRGDVDFTAIGTVTRVDGERILAFGHPFLQLGSVEYPMTRARVETLLPSLSSSFKIASSGGEIGAFYQDRVTGISGRLGAKAHMVPVRIDIQGPSGHPRSFAYEVVDDPLLTPILLYMTLGGILETTEKAAGEASIEMKEGSALLLAGGKKVDLSDLYAGENSLLAATTSLGLIAEFLMQNEHETSRIEGVQLVVSYSPDRRKARITDAWADRTQVHAGERVHVTVGLKPYREETGLETIEIEIPRELPPGRFTLHVGDALNITRVEQAGAESFQPMDLDGLIEMINSLRKNRALGILGTREEPSVLIGSDRYRTCPPRSLPSFSGRMGGAVSPFSAHAPSSMKPA